MAVTIYHNPRCSKSRMTLELITESGAAHNVVPYLDNAPDGATIITLAEKLGLRVSSLLRRREKDFKEAINIPNLADDSALAEWLSLHPIVIERPIVVDQESGKAVIGRPPENELPFLS